MCHKSNFYVSLSWQNFSFNFVLWKGVDFFPSILPADAETLSLRGFSLTFKLNFLYESTISIELFKLSAQGIAFGTQVSKVLEMLSDISKSFDIVFELWQMH